MRFIVVVREIGRLKPDYSVEFEAPALPTIGSYISISRPDAPHGHTEDLVVRRVWWRLHHPNTSGYGSEQPEVGSLIDVQVECNQAIGPNSRDMWRSSLEAARSRGIDVEEFEVARFSVSETELNDMRTLREEGAAEA